MKKLVAVRVTEEQLARLKADAETQNRSMNNYLINLWMKHREDQFLRGTSLRCGYSSYPILTKSVTVRSEMFNVVAMLACLKPARCIRNVVARKYGRRGNTRSLGWYVVPQGTMRKCWLIASSGVSLAFLLCAGVSCLVIRSFQIVLMHGVGL